MNDGMEFYADDGIRLAGTLVTRDAGVRLPAALIISGSGALDRDSNMAGQTLDVASAIAHALLERGVASLRYDKRGVGQSAGTYLATGFHEETSDADAALVALRTRPEVDPTALTVVGHSVGATIAIRLARAHTALRGVVLLCAASRPGDVVMRHQSERIAESMTGLRRFRRGPFLRRQARARHLLLASRDDIACIDGHDVPARWFREYMTYDPAPDLLATRCPVLAITGRSDIQVDPDDVAQIGDLVEAAFTGSTPEGLTHLLRTHSGSSGLSTYPDQLRRPVDADLLDMVTSWIATRSYEQA